MGEKIGSVLVVGGGVGGMQAALDLAEAGIKVYLVDRESSIGGTMPQLDKTFPTNDCSMCIVSPRLVDVGRHLNIDILSNTDVTEVSGKPGHFKVKLRQRARYIDLDKCTGCGTCSEVCPVVRQSEFDQNMAKRKAVFRRYPQAVPSAFTIEKTGMAKCRQACPADVNAQAYVNLTAQGKYHEALMKVKEENPLPGICGRVCTHPCEAACYRAELDEPVSIMAIKRFLSDYELKQQEPVFPPCEATKREERVAIVGAGPAGLTAAYYLARMGYQPTIFEKFDKAGGMLVCGIPAYRLPRDIIAKEVEAILKTGVELKLNSPLGPDRTPQDLMEKEGFQAVFLAIGAYEGMKLRIEGEDDYSGLKDCVTFLREVNLEGSREVGENVVVIGGGNAAIDSARTALRLGAKNVTIVYRRSRREMPANAWEIDEAEREGVKIHYLAAPVKILGQDGKVTGMECIKMELGAPDASGRRRPVPVEGSNFEIKADMIIPAISQRPDTSFLPENHGFEISRWNSFVVDPTTLQTNIEGIFAGGDAVTGPKTAIEAIAAGKEAAISIDRYLRGEDMYAGREPIVRHPAEPDLDGFPKLPRIKIPVIPVEKRLDNFNEVEELISEEAAVAEARRCLSCSVCCECMECVKACEAGAIDHFMDEEKELLLDVGAVLLSPGFKLFQPDLKEELGYSRYDNVLTSLEFERVLSASGPFQGHVQRPSDGREPKRIAFIQCVGSREAEHNYCSSVCCMYATKEAVIAKEHVPGLECHIFYIDIRAFGKGFDEYYERAKSHGVIYHRSLPSFLKENPTNQNIRMRYRENGQLVNDEFDMVILSCGLRPPQSVQQLAQVMGIELNEHGFCRTQPMNPVKTTREGVFACGPFCEPKDIPETVVEASGAAAEVLRLLGSERGTLVKKKEYPPERDVRAEEPRIGVFVCHCGKNIGGVIEVPKLAQTVAHLPNVVYAEDRLYACSQDSIASIQEKVKEHNLNRVVVASCTPRTHEPLFRESIREAGLNPYMFEMANIRDQCTWVHQQEGSKAWEKAKGLIAMAVARARYHKPLYKQQIDLVRRALVIGGGIAGMTVAKNLGDQGFEVVLIEKEAQLGGNVRNLYGSFEGEIDPQQFYQQLIQEVSSHPQITIHTQAQVTDMSGFVGNFKLKISQAEAGELEIQAGVIVVATGAVEYKGNEYLYGQAPQVMTQLEFEKKLHTAAQEIKGAKNVVMIQCVGSRQEDRAYCSRVCCTGAIKLALHLKEISPETNIYILYRDVRSYGFREQYYRQAREKGVIFMRYDKDAKPDVSSNGQGLVVKIKDQMLNGAEMTLRPDYLVLSMAAVPPQENLTLAPILKVSTNIDNFMLEAHMKLRPVEFASDGIFLCGTAHFPKFMEETVAQSLAAASRAATILSKEHLTVGGPIAVVDEDLCAACVTCVRACPYHVPQIVDGVAKIEPAQCQGCGTCAGVCPAQAIQLLHSTDEEILAACENLNQ